MQFPRPKSHGDTVFRALHEHGAMTMQQFVERCGNIGTMLSDTKQVFVRAAFIGFIKESDGVFSLMPFVAKYYDDMLTQGVPKQAVVRVPPRTPMPFRSTGKYILSIQCGRPGAMDYRDIPSIMAGERVAYEPLVITSSADKKGAAK